MNRLYARPNRLANSIWQAYLHFVPVLTLFVLGQKFKLHELVAPVRLTQSYSPGLHIDPNERDLLDIRT